MGFWKKEEKTHFERDEYGKVKRVSRSNGSTQSVYDRFKPEIKKKKYEQRVQRLEKVLAREKKLQRERKLRHDIQKTRASYRPPGPSFGFGPPPAPRRRTTTHRKKKSNKRKKPSSRRKPAHPWDWYSGFIR